MIRNKHKAIIYLLLLSIVAMPVASAFASIASGMTPVEFAVDAEEVALHAQPGAQHDSSHHSSNPDMSDHVVKTAEHCDTSKANCNQCDDCSHCVNLIGCSSSKPAPLFGHYISSRYPDLYRSVDQSLLLRPPIRS